MMDQYAWLAVLTLAQIIQFLITKRNGKPKTIYKYNPHPPGESPVCRDNRDKIIKLEERVRELKEDVTEIKRKVNGK